MRNGVAVSATGAGFKTVERAMAVLHAFSHREPEMTISALSRRLGLHKSTVSRLVAHLCRWRLLDRDPDTGAVRVGIGAFELGTVFARRQTLYTTAATHLAALAARTHSAFLAVPDGVHALIAVGVDSPNIVRVIVKVGERKYLHTSAGGKLFLAFGPPTLLPEAARQVGFPRLTPHTITSARDLAHEVARVRREGTALNWEESTLGAGALAAPILGADGAVAAAVTIVFPTSLVRRADLETLRRAVTATADRIATAMGWSEHPSRAGGRR